MIESRRPLSGREALAVLNDRIQVKNSRRLRMLQLKARSPFGP
jgi:hypothetical protein